LARAADASVEAVERVPQQVLGRDAEKSELIKCATINDLMLGKGQVTPEDIVLISQKEFFYKLVTPRYDRYYVKNQKNALGSGWSPLLL
jgi:hypothetical protein